MGGLEAFEHIRVQAAHGSRKIAFLRVQNLVGLSRVVDLTDVRPPVPRMHLHNAARHAALHGRVVVLVLHLSKYIYELLVLVAHVRQALVGRMV